MIFLKLGELLAKGLIKNGNFPYDAEVLSAVSDSRKVTPGALFIAMQGEKQDGRAHIKEALDRGAAFVICEGDDQIISDDRILLCDNVRRTDAHIQASLHGDAQDKLTIVAVTGTNGKTTTAQMIHDILQASGIKTGLIGTVRCDLGSRIVDSDMTTPDTERLYSYLDEMQKSGCTHCVMEASSHALAYEKLSPMKIKVGVFLNLSREHLDYHKTMEAYAQAKAKLFSLCGNAIVNADDAYRSYMTGRAEKDFFFSLCDKSADFPAMNTISYGLEGSGFYLHERYFHISLAGEYFISDALAAIGACSLLGIDEEKCAHALSQFRSVAGRMEKVDLASSDFSIFIDFAHTPESLRRTLLTARSADHTRLCVVFGCGGERDRGKRALMGEVAAAIADRVIITSDNPRGEDPMDIINEVASGTNGKAAIIEDRESAIDYAVQTAIAGEIILIAGKGHEEYMIRNGIKTHFSDMECAKKAYEKHWGEEKRTL